jgi:phenylacetate-CoA ligase
MIVTRLYKDDVAPCIRFNTHDVSAFRTEGNATGIVFRRIKGLLGRSDNMVKLKDTNVFPRAIGALIENRAELTGEHGCRMTRDAKGNDTMTVTLEHRAADSDTSGLGAVVLTGPAGTAAATQIAVRQQPIRLIDEREL